MKVIRAKKITKKNFSKFGQLIDTSKKNPININDGLLYTSPSPRDKRQSRMPSSA